MKKLFSFLLPFFSLALHAQEPALLSLKGYGGNEFDQIATYITPTADGGFIVCINSNSYGTTGNLDTFCMTGSSLKYGDIFLKYNADGGVREWTRCYGQDGDSSFLFIFPTNDSGFIIAGEFNSVGNAGGLIMKENAADSVIWCKSYSRGYGAILRNMLSTADGGYITVWQVFYTDTNFTVHNSGSLFGDIGVIKIDSNGNKIWSKDIGGTYDEDVGSVVAAPNGGCYILGTTYSNDYDCTGLHGPPDSLSDVYLARLDSNGNILWHHDLGGSAADGAALISGYGCADWKGGIIIAARTRSSNGDVHHYIGNEDYWALEVDSSNNILWDNCYGSADGDEVPLAVCKASDGSIWLNGYTDGSGNDIDTNYGGQDAWVAHADSIGNFLSGKSLGSTQDDWGTMIYPLSNGTVLAGGYYSDSTGLFNSIKYYGADTIFASDAFLAILAPWTTYISQFPEQNDVVKVYPNPANKLLNIKNEEGANFYIIVNDVYGRQVYKANCIIDNETINISNWSKGMYFIQIIDNNGFKTTQKLLIE